MTQVIDWDLISSYVGILSLATLSVYAGSYGSLTAPKKPKDIQKPEEEDEDEDEDEDIADRLSSSDAYMFPVIGSVTLFGLYLIVKFLGPEWINYLLSWYFSIFGAGSVWRSSISLAKQTLGRETWKSYDRIKFLILRRQFEVLNVSLRTPSLLLLPLSLIPSTVFIFSPKIKSAVLTDVLALSFAHNVLSFGKIDAFATGCILLAGLFFYDIWWVFGTEVMVKVATSLDVPIKILWPKSLLFSTERGFTMLGLGDIVVPGMFVSLALRYDFARANGKDTRQAFAKPYFMAAITAYVAGLVTTMFVMHTFKAAQPALLYLSPACILSFFVTALVRGELKEAWAWKDESEQSSSESEKIDDGVSNVKSDIKTTAVPFVTGTVPDLKLTPASAEGDGSSSLLSVDDNTDRDGQSGDDLDSHGDGDAKKGKKKRSKKKKA